MKPADRPVGRKLGPGLRVVKTGMAVTLCLLISYALPLGQPLASAIAAVAVMEKSIDFSLRTARDGAAGILIGAVVGLLFSYAGHGNAGLCGIGVIITLYVCVLLKLERGVLLSELTLFSVMLTPPSGFYWQHTLTCAADALIGILVALTVNLIVMPHHYAGEVRENYEALCAVAAQALHAARAGAPAPCKQLAAQTERLARSIEAYVSERRLLRGSDEEIFRISCRLSSFREFSQELGSVQFLQSPENDRLPDQDREIIRRYHMARLESLAALCLPAKEERQKKNAAESK